MRGNDAASIFFIQNCSVFLLLERVKVFVSQEMFHFLLEIYYAYFFRDLIALIALNFPDVSVGF